MIKWVLVFVLWVCALNAKEQNVDFYRHLMLGQRDFDIYAGPIDPRFQSFGENPNQTQFLDDFRIFYYTENLTFQAGDQVRSLLNDLDINTYMCPNVELASKVEFIRYAYRLISISYLIESIKLYKTSLYELGLSEKTCGADIRKLLYQCEASSEEMKKFLRRYKTMELEEKDLSKLVKKDTPSLKKWVRSVLNPSIQRDFTQMRIALNSKSEDEVNSTQKIGKKIREICAKDGAEIVKICSEKDSVYSASNFTDIRNALLDSHLSHLIEQDKQRPYCLIRYGKLSKGKERISDSLQLVLSEMPRILKERKGKNYLGEAFIPGSLKEFDDKGLKNFLFKKKEVPPPPKIVEFKKPVMVVKPKPLPKPKPVKVTPVKKVEVKPVVVPPPPIKIVSQFEIAYQRFLESGKTEEVNMKFFGQQFRVSKKKAEKLGRVLGKFQKRVALQDMVELDRLGSKVEPLRLSFLKFLIDYGHHQGLWNIVAVIGEHFYVYNNIENQKIPIYIRLYNGKETKHRWQIDIKKPPLPKKKKKK